MPEEKKSAINSISFLFCFFYLPIIFNAPRIFFFTLSGNTFSANPIAFSFIPRLFLHAWNNPPSAKSSANCICFASLLRAAWYMGFFSTAFSYAVSVRFNSPRDDMRFIPFSVCTRSTETPCGFQYESCSVQPQKSPMVMSDEWCFPLYLQLLHDGLDSRLNAVPYSVS